MGTVYRHNPHHPLHTPLRVMVHVNPNTIPEKNCHHHHDTTTTTDDVLVLYKFRNDPYHYENGAKYFYPDDDSLPTPNGHDHGEDPSMGLTRPEEGAFGELKEKSNYCDDYCAMGVMTHHHDSYDHNDKSYYIHEEAAAIGGHRTNPLPLPRAGPLLPEYEDFKETSNEGESHLNAVSVTTATTANHDHEDFHAPALAGKVSYVPYPKEEFYCPPPTMAREEMTRLFIGQLPYDVTDMQLQWLCYTFGNGAIVHHPERIMKKRESHFHHNGATIPPPPPQYGGVGVMNDRDRSAPHGGGGAPRVSTGCIHAYCHPEDAAALMEGMHKRILVDDNGVWYAAPPPPTTDGHGLMMKEEEEDGELFHLNAHVASMKANKNLRPINRPYDTVVAQTAVSTYVPRPPSYNTTKKMVKGGQAELR